MANWWEIDWNPSHSTPANIIGNATQDVSLNKPFGNSTLSTLYGGNGGLNSVLNNVSWDKPFGTNSTLGLALYGNQQAPLTTKGVVKETGEQLVYDPTAPPGAGYGLPTSKQQSQVAGQDVIQMGPQAPRSALALEERLRSEARKKLTPNTEFNFNLETNPITKSPFGSFVPGGR